MLDSPQSGTRVTNDAGFVEHLRSFIGTGMDYLGARLQLAGLESQEASAHYLKIVILAAAAVFAVLFGYFFLWAAVVFIIATLFHVQWMWVMLGCAILHLVAAAICLGVAYNKLKTPMFTATLNEFKKDREWLSNQKYS